MSGDVQVNHLLIELAAASRQMVEAQRTIQAFNETVAGLRQTVAAKADHADVAVLVETVAAWPTPASILADAAPTAVALDSKAGSAERASRADHTHVARVQRKVVTLDAGGLATWTFNRPFTAKPSLSYMVFQSSGQPVFVDAVSWTIGTGAAANQFLGVQVRGQRAQTLPGLSGILLLGPLISQLASFNVFGGGALTGVEVHLSAGDVM